MIDLPNKEMELNTSNETNLNLKMPNFENNNQLID